MGGLLYGRYGSAALFRTAALALAAGWAGASAVLWVWGDGTGAHGGAGGRSAAAAPRGKEAEGYRQLEMRASSEEAEDASLLART